MPPLLPERTVVLGAGPAGLMAALELARAGRSVCVVERGERVGGLGGTTGFAAASGTYRFDFGGHRFITRSRELLETVEELLGDDLLVATRSSVVRFGGRTYAYPLSVRNLVRTAPPRLLFGALRDLATLGRRPAEDGSFADWVESRFGPTLYRAFFEGYTRKLWGIEPSELSGDWASQRISLIDLRDVAQRLVASGRDTPRTYARRYRYPRLGFGVLFERLAERVVKEGGEIRTGASATGFRMSGDRIAAVEIETATGREELEADHVIATLPLPAIVRMTGGECDLRFRGLRFFNLVMDQPDVSPHTWQYLADPGLVGTRLQEPKRRSPAMAPAGRTSLMVEIPCDPGDALWSASDADVFARVSSDLATLGIDPSRATGECFSVRTSTAYPLLSLGYEHERARAIAHVSRIENLSPCGRQGTFRYIFSDTAMEMGMTIARGLIERPGERVPVWDYRNERTVIEVDSIA